MLLIDAHLDLAMNALHWNRDITRPVAETRAAEEGMTQKGRCAGTVALPEMRAGEVGVCVATLIARVERSGNPLSGYRSPAIAAAVARGQLAYYRILEEAGELRLIQNAAELDAHVGAWESGDARQGSADHHPIGVILSMEGADPILSPDCLGEWW